MLITFNGPHFENQIRDKTDAAVDIAIYSVK